MSARSWTIALSTGCCRRAPLAAVLRAIRAAGISRVEIGTPPEHFNPDDRLLPWQLGAELAALPIVPVSIHAPFGAAMDLASPHAGHREAGIEGALAAARTLAGRPDAIVVAHPSDLLREGGDTRARLRWSLESLLIVDAFCRDARLRLAVETPLPHLVGGHPDEMAWLLERLPPSVGMCLDTGHAYLGRHIDAFVRLAGERLVHVHLHDNRGTFDDHLIPGRGAIDWCEVFDALRRVNYAGALVLELACAEPSVTHFAEAFAAAHDVCRAHAPAMLPAHLSGAKP